MIYHFTQVEALVAVEETTQEGTEAKALTEITEVAEAMAIKEEVATREAATKDRAAMEVGF